ncbi:hypothetical protein H0H93_002958 [Arthromyces matolae]|nr:hypothetical protein H0H93_002958 [Arthromyces matolae]
MDSSSLPDLYDQDRFSYKLATQEEVLDDLSSRFILNLPDDELSSLERICFQVEQAHWFYEDFIREENPKFPSLPLKKFSEMLFQSCPLLQQWSHDHESAYTHFMQYKTRVPVCGAIMLNDTWEKCLLVKGWKASSGWGFPKGKINQVEPPASCAIREVLEETGYNLAGQLNPEHLIEMSIREQKISLFVVPGVPEDYPFKTKTRKEISKIEWFRLADLPTWKRNKTSAGRFYLISPFIGPLKAFINSHKPRSSGKNPRPKKNQLVNSVQSASHESSSQSSSVENNELDTSPSRQVRPNTTAISGEQFEGTDTSTMDPHFASLLSALAMSASKGSSQQPTVLSLDDIRSNQTDETMIPSDSSRYPPQETISALPSLSAQSPATPSKPFPSAFSEPPVTQEHDTANAVDTSTPNADATVPSTTGLSLPTPSSTANTVHAPLYRQHVALLDAVSKESARLQEAYKIAAANGVSINIPDNIKTSVVPYTQQSLIPASSALAPPLPVSMKGRSLCAGSPKDAKFGISFLPDPNYQHEPDDSTPRPHEWITHKIGPSTQHLLTITSQSESIAAPL